MVLSLSPNPKGEVAVGFGEKVTVIVDDVFRRHHVFHMRQFFPTSGSSRESSSSSQTVSNVNQVIFSRSSNILIALVDEKFILIWRRVTGSENYCDTWEFIDKIGPTKRNILRMEVTPDDNYIILIEVTGSVSCYNFTNCVFGVIYTHTSPLIALSISRLGNLIATGDPDGTIILNKFPQSYEIEHFITKHKGPITDLMFTKYFLISGGMDGFLNLWNFKTGECLTEIDLAKITGVENPVVHAIHHHCRLRRIIVVVKGSIKIFWFDYDKQGRVVKQFLCDLPVELNIIITSFDIHGLFWVGTNDVKRPISMFFIDLEQSEIFEVDEVQEHRLKALVKYVYNGNTSVTNQNLLCSNIDNYLQKLRIILQDHNI